MPLRTTLSTILAIFLVSVGAGAVSGRQALAGPGQTEQQSPKSADSSLEGVTVKEISFPNVSSENDRKEFLQLVTQPLGQPMNRLLIRESIQKLYATGRFSDIRAEASRTPDGEAGVAFITDPTEFVGRVQIEGAPKRPTESQISNASKLGLGTVFTQERLNLALKNIAQLMETNGFYQSYTSADQQLRSDTQQVELVFHVNPGPQARVGKISFTGNTLYSAEDLEKIAKLHPGDFVTVQRISDALDRLRKRYQKQNRWLAQVSLSKRVYQPDADVVDFAFVLQRGPVVNVTADGFKLSRSVLRRTVPVYEENAVDDDLLNEGRRNLVNHLQGLGYYGAKVTLEKQSNKDGSELSFVYHIDAGARHKLVRVTMSGNKYFGEDLLRARMQIQPADRFVYPHGRFSQGMLASDVRSVEEQYRASGFSNVKVSSLVEDDYKGIENDLAVNFQVIEGPQTLVRALNITGVAGVPNSILPTLNLGEGQPYSENAIASDREILLNYYFNLGFPNATFEASATPATDKPNSMDVKYKMELGNQVFVDQVLISGLVHTRRYIVQRELEIKAGDPLSQAAMLKTQQNLYDLGIFSQVDTAVQNPDGVEPYKKTLISMQEAKRYTFTYGLGFEFQTGQPSTGTNQALGGLGVSPLVSFEVTRLNFLGRNHTVAVKTNVGSLQQRGLVSYSAPRLFGDPKWRLSLTTFYDNTVDVTTYTSQRLEGTIQAEQTISRASILNYRFSFRRVKAVNAQISANLIPLLSQPVRVGGPGFSYIRNKRDSDLESSKGSYNTLDFSVAAGAFGSEADFTRILAQNSTYHAFGKRRQTDKKFVLARSLRIGVENTFGNTSILQPSQTCIDPTQTTCNVTLVPLAERFLSGGGNSHRGFGLNQAGPRDPQTGFPLGGSALFLNNIELRFPPRVWPYVQDNLSFALFEDAGNVFTDGRTMLDNLLRWRQKNPDSCRQPGTASQCDYAYVSHAIGLGVRYKTPVGPVRFDFGYNLNPPVFPSCLSSPDPAGSAKSSYCTADAGSPYFVPQQASHFNVFFSIGQSF